MARKTIIVGLNQTTMAALSMAIIASYVDGPGLGKPVLRALVRNDVGGAIVPGILIVADRDHARPCDDRRQRARRARRPRPGPQRPARARSCWASARSSSSSAIWYSRQSVDAATFPKSGFGSWLADRLDSLVSWVVNLLDGPAEAFKNFITTVLLNPMQNLLAESPWWLTALGIAAIALILGGLTRPDRRR